MVHRPIATTIQRQIMAFRAGRWEVAKVGTKGTHQPPAQPNPGMGFFNTVTGIQGPTIASVEAGLADLMVIKGSLRDAQINLQWDAALWNDLNAATAEGGVNELGYVRLRSGHAPWYRGSSVPATFLLRRTWTLLLEPFMNRNGQLPYMYAQPWYRNRAAVIDVSVNFYKNRAAIDRSFEFHKDTAGDNLFVNLIFNNARPILATEWTVDTRAMKQKKKARMTTFMGDSSVADTIEQTRQDIVAGTYSPKGTARIEGGVATGQAAFVSWVDELVWHSSPFAGSRRARISRAQVCRDHRKYVLTDRSSVQDQYDFALIRGALRALRRIAGTRVHAFGKPGGKAVHWLDQIDAYIATIVNADGTPKQPAWNAHLADVNANFAQISIGLGEEQASDPSNQGEQISRATEIGTRPRRNSAPGKLADRAAASATTEPRSFIRTWVQIHHT